MSPANTQIMTREQGSPELPHDAYCPVETNGHDYVRLSPNLRNHSTPSIPIYTTNGPYNVKYLTRQVETLAISQKHTPVLQHNAINIPIDQQMPLSTPSFLCQYMGASQPSVPYNTSNGQTTARPSFPSNSTQITYGHSQMGGTTNVPVPIYSASQPLAPLTQLYAEPVVSYNTYPPQVYEENNHGYSFANISEQYSQIPNHPVTTQGSSGQLVPAATLPAMTQQVQNLPMPPPIQSIPMTSQPVMVPDQQNSAFPPVLYNVFITAEPQQVIMPSDNKLVPSGQHFNPLTDSANMDIVWHGYFNQLFSSLGMWILIPLVNNSDVNEKEFISTNDSAKVRFLCQHCCNAWTSMKGRIQFFYQVYPQNNGLVYFKLYGQKCKKCMPKEFEHSMWYPEEVHKVLWNLFHKVRSVIYNQPLPTLQKERRAGKPRTEHNSDLCQACSMGACREKRTNEI